MCELVFVWMGVRHGWLHAPCRLIYFPFTLVDGCAIPFTWNLKLNGKVGKRRIFICCCRSKIWRKECVYCRKCVFVSGTKKNPVFQLAKCEDPNIWRRKFRPQTGRISFGMSQFIDFHSFPRKSRFSIVKHSNVQLERCAILSQLMIQIRVENKIDFHESSIANHSKAPELKARDE